MSEAGTQRSARGGGGAARRAERSAVRIEAARGEIVLDARAVHLDLAALPRPEGADGVALRVCVCAGSGALFLVPEEGECADQAALFPAGGGPC